MIHIGPGIIDQLIALMLPDHSLHFQGSRTLYVTPAVAPVGRVVGILNDVKTASLHGQRHCKEILELQRFKLVIHHLIQSHCQFTNDTHASSITPLFQSLYTPNARLLTTTGTKPSPSTTSPTSMKSNSDRLISSTQGRFHFDESMPPTTRPTFCSKTRASGLSSTDRPAKAASIPLASSCTAP